MDRGRATGIAVVAAAAVLAAAAPVAAQTPRVLLVGDSWAAFFWQTEALSQTFERNPLSLSLMSVDTSTRRNR